VLWELTGAERSLLTTVALPAGRTGSEPLSLVQEVIL